MASYKRVMLTERETPVAQNPQAVQNDVNAQLNKFDTTYTSKKLNDLYNQFDSITFNDVNNATIVKENVMVQTGAQVSFKTAVYLTTAVIVTLLLAFLAIYNIFVINGLNSNIQLLQEDVAVAEAQFNNLNNQNNLTEEELKQLIKNSLKGNYDDISDNGFVSVALLETNPTGNYDIDTNWFDQFCTFLSNLFGG